MRTNDAISAELITHINEYREVNRRIALCSLEQIAVLLDTYHPEAELLIVTETDQDLSGSLMAGEYATDVQQGDAFGTFNRHDLSDEAQNDLYDPLCNLDDSNRDTWERYLVDGVSKFGGPSPLDVRRIRAEFEPPGHECGMCDSPLAFDGIDIQADGEHRTWRCTSHGCGWWHTSIDCCEDVTA